MCLVQEEVDVGGGVSIIKNPNQEVRDDSMDQCEPLIIPNLDRPFNWPS